MGRDSVREYFFLESGVICLFLFCFMCRVVRVLIWVFVCLGRFVGFIVNFECLIFRYRVVLVVGNRRIKGVR